MEFPPAVTWVEERVDEASLSLALQIARENILTELRDSGLLEEKDEWYTVPGSESEYGKITSQDKKIMGHNTLARAIKAHINNLMNPSNL